MACDITKKFIGNVIDSKVDEWIEASPYNLNRTNNFYYSEDKYDELVNYFNDKLKEFFMSNGYSETKAESLADEIRILEPISDLALGNFKVAPDFSTMVLDDIATEEKSDIDGSQEQQKLYKKHLVVELSEGFQEEKETFREIVQGAIAALQKTVRPKQFKELLIASDKTVFNELRKKWESLKVQMVRDDFDSQINAFSDYLIDARRKTDAYLSIANEMKENPNNDNTIAHYKNIELLARAYLPVMLELNDYFSANQINTPIARVIGDVMRNIKAVESIYEEQALGHVSGVLKDWGFNQSKLAKNVAAIHANIASLQRRIRDAEEQRDITRVKRLEKKLDTAKKDLERLPNSQKAIIHTLKGYNGDIGLFSSMLMSATANKDIIISGFGNFIRKMLNKLNSEVIVPIAKEYEDVMSAYSPNGVLRAEKEFIKFVNEVNISFYDWDTGKIDSRREVWFKHGTDKRYYEQLSLKRATMKKATVDLKRAEETSEGIVEARVAHLNATQDWEAFQEKYVQRPYTDVYYAPKNTFREKSLQLFQETGYDIKSKEEAIQEETDNLYTQAKVLKGFVILNIDETQRLDELRKERSRLRSVTWWESQQIKLAESLENQGYSQEEALATATEAYQNEIRGAEILDEYRKEMQDRERRVLINEDWDGVNRWKEKVELLESLRGVEITEEEFQKQYHRITEVNFPEEWREARFELRQQERDLLKRISAKSGTEIGSEGDVYWDVILSTARPYRDSQGVPDGNLMTLAEQKTVKENQEESKEYVNNLLSALGKQGELDQLRLDRQEAWDDAAKLREELTEYKLQPRQDHEYKESLNNQVTEAFNRAKRLTKEVKEFKETTINSLDPSLQILIRDFIRLQAERRELESYVTNEYYDEAVQQAKLEFLKTNGIGDTTSFSVKNKSYVLEDGVWYTKKLDGSTTLFTGDINKVWLQNKEKDFKNSEWYTANHIVKENTFKGVTTYTYDPIYVWTKIIPKDTNRFPITHSPGFMFKIKEVRDTLASNPEVKLKSESSIDEVTGEYAAKEGTYENQDQAYLEMRAVSKDAKLLDFLLKDYKLAQEHYPGSKRMGYRIPTVERKLSSLWDLNNLSASTVKQLVARDFQTTEQDIDSGEGSVNESTTLSDTMGVELKTLPHYYATHLEPELISTNVVQSVLRYRIAAEKNKMFSEEIEPATSSALDVMERNTPSTGNKDVVWTSLRRNMDNFVTGKLGMKGLVKKKHSQNNRLAILDEFVNMWVYGQTINPDHTLGKGKFRFDKLLSKLRGWKSFTALATLPFQGYVFAREGANVMNGVYQQMVQTMTEEGKVKFTFADWRLAVKQYSKELIQGGLVMDYLRAKVGRKSKLGALMDHFHVLEGKLMDEAGNTITDKNAGRRWTDIFFVVKNSAEHFLYGTTFLAYMNNQVVDYKGRSISLFEAYDVVNGEAVLKEGVDVDVTQVSTDIQDLLRITQGNYAKLDKTILENRWYGPGIVWMKKFVVPFLMVRYGERRFSINDMDSVQGHFRHSFSILREELWKNPKDWNVKDFSTAIEDLSDQEKASLKKTGFEIAMISIFAMMIMMAYDEDDEDRFKKMDNRSDIIDWGVFWAMKSRSEMMTMTPIGYQEHLKMLGGMPASVFPHLDTAYKLLMEDIIDFKRTKRDTYGYEKGTSKLWIDIVKLTGALKPSKSSAEQTIRNWEAIQKRR